MSDKDFQSISANTGQFPALTSLPKVLGGNSKPDTGKQVPVAEFKKPDIEALAEQLNVASQNVGRDLRFQVNLDSRRTVIQVLDRETGEIIRQIPPEKAEIYLAESGNLALRLLDASA